jgi:hypothetical protein
MAKANLPYMIGDEVTIYNPWSNHDYSGVVVGIVPAGYYAEEVVWGTGSWLTQKILGDIAFRQGVIYEYETYIVRPNDTNKLVRPLAHSIMLDKRPVVTKPKPKAAKKTKPKFDGSPADLLKFDGTKWAPIFKDNAPLLKQLMKEAVKEVLAELFSTTGKV